MRPSAAFLVALSISTLWLTNPASAESQPGSATPPGIPETLPGVPPAVPKDYVICPPAYPAPQFVPPELLLQQADSVQPLNELGWIVTTRPVDSCDRITPDAATREFRDITYPLQLRQLDTQIRLAQVELANWRERVDVYRYFNKTGVLMVDYQNSQLTVLALQERVRNLRYERMLVIRHRNRELALEKEQLASRATPAARQP